VDILCYLFGLGHFHSPLPYQATADETIVQAVTGVLGMTGEEVREK